MARKVKDKYHHLQGGHSEFYFFKSEERLGKRTQKGQQGGRRASSVDGENDLHSRYDGVKKFSPQAGMGCRNSHQDSGIKFALTFTTIMAGRGA